MHQKHQVRRGIFTTSRFRRAWDIPWRCHRNQVAKWTEMCVVIDPVYEWSLAPRLGYSTRIKLSVPGDGSIYPPHPLGPRSQYESSLWSDDHLPWGEGHSLFDFLYFLGRCVLKEGKHIPIKPHVDLGRDWSTQQWLAVSAGKNVPKTHVRWCYEKHRASGVDMLPDQIPSFRRHGMSGPNWLFAQLAVDLGWLLCRLWGRWLTLMKKLSILRPRGGWWPGSESLVCTTYSSNCRIA